MRLLLVRHAIALDAREFAGRDAERPLTEDGRRRFERGARALAAQVPDLALVLSSPYVRARQTAEVLLDAFDAAPRRDELDALTPDGDPRETVAALARHRDLPAVALVGHEPSLSALEALLLVGRERSFAVFKKGGAALLDWIPASAPGSAALVWHLTAGQLRDLAP